MDKNIGAPTLVISFKRAAEETAARLKRGIVALILKDTGVTAGLYALTDPEDAPEGLGVDNEACIQRAFTGWTNTPRQVLVSVIGEEDDLAEKGAAALAASDFDYLAGPPDIDQDGCQKLKTWLTAARKGYCIGKAVLPAYEADDMAVVNFASTGIKVKETTYTGAQYCSRIAGILAGTPVGASATYAQLPEVTAVDAVEDLDAAVNAGKLVLVHDGRKAKIVRAVNSLQTVPKDLPDSLKKIKVVEGVDQIRAQVRLLVEDEYIGRMANSYDNKLLLVTALQSYLAGLESEGVLSADSSWAELDVEKTKAWLKENGVDVSGMSDTQILRQDTGSWVFLRLGGVFQDAMEDFDLTCYMGATGGNAA